MLHLPQFQIVPVLFETQCMCVCEFSCKKCGAEIVKEAGTFVCLMESPALLKECGLRCLNVTFYKLIQR